VASLVFSSTCAVFGEPVATPIDESHPTRPINAYGETKLAIERALPHHERAYGIHAMSLRYFNAAGADPDGDLGEDHRPERHLIPLALDAVRGGKPLEVYGDDYPTPDGTCLRDYIHVWDLAQAHLLALDRLEREPRSAVYNLGVGHPFSVRDVLLSVERVTGRPVPHTIVRRREGDPAVLFASNARIRTELGWSPRFGNLDDIVGTAWRWLQAHPRKYSEWPG
jgi:UDP-glucose-4-epimerase GalE